MSEQNPYISNLLLQAVSEKKQIKKILQKLKLLPARLLDNHFQEAHEHVFSEEISCLDCTNCCRTLGPRLTDKDIDRLAKFMKMKPSQFTTTYLQMDEDGDYVFKQMPCPFLQEDNLCSVYDSRPKACREYPHTDSRKMHKLLTITRKNAVVCPAVYLVLKKIEAKSKS